MVFVSHFITNKEKYIRLIIIIIHIYILNSQKYGPFSDNNYFVNFLYFYMFIKVFWGMNKDNENMWHCYFGNSNNNNNKNNNTLFHLTHFIMEVNSHKILWEFCIQSNWTNWLLFTQRFVSKNVNTTESK